jgi:hypothetical protein
MAVRTELATVSEDLTAQVDGTEIDFELSMDKFRPGTARVEINGIPQNPGVDFIELTENTVRTTLGFVLQAPDQIVVFFVPQ